MERERTLTALLSEFYAGENEACVVTDCDTGLDGQVFHINCGDCGQSAGGRDVPKRNLSIRVAV